MSEDNLEYYERRAREEMTAAGLPERSEAAASAHRLLAIEHEAQARELRAGQQQRPKLTLRMS